MASELREQTLAFLRKHGAVLRSEPGTLAEPKLRSMLENVVASAFDVLAVAFGEESLSTIRSEIHELAQIDKLNVRLPELAAALSHLDFTVETFRLALGIDGEPIARLIHEGTMGQRKGTDFVSEHVAAELRKQGWSDETDQSLRK